MSIFKHSLFVSENNNTGALKEIWKTRERREGGKKSHSVSQYPKTTTVAFCCISCQFFFCKYSLYN